VGVETGEGRAPAPSCSGRVDDAITCILYSRSVADCNTYDLYNLNLGRFELIFTVSKSTTVHVKDWNPGLHRVIMPRFA
jgi:hypothetical protein